MNNNEYDSTPVLVETVNGLAMAPRWMADMLRKIHGDGPLPVGDEVKLEDVIDIKLRRTE